MGLVSQRPGKVLRPGGTRIKLKQNTKCIPLAKGQLWQMEDKHLEIVELGKRLTHYRLLSRPDQRGVPVRLGGAEELQAYLSANKAKLVVRTKKVAPKAAA